MICSCGTAIVVPMINIRSHMGFSWRKPIQCPACLKWWDVIFEAKPKPNKREGAIPLTETVEARRKRGIRHG
jgi:hypothetical protein